MSKKHEREIALSDSSSGINDTGSVCCYVGDGLRCSNIPIVC